MATAVHHHRNVTSKANKPFKSKFASKGSLKDLAKGKAIYYLLNSSITIAPGRLQERGIRRTPHQQVMSKIDRRHQARQKQQAKHQDRIKANSIFSGAHGAPRNVAVITLTEGGDPQAAIRQLNESVDVDNQSVDDDRLHVRVERFKQNVIYMLVKGSFLRALDTCRLADFVVLVLSAQEEVDEDGELLLKSIGGQGISNVYAVVQV
jgi:pre-rRNA-processing protein TSR1